MAKTIGTVSMKMIFNANDFALGLNKAERGLRSSLARMERETKMSAMQISKAMGATSFELPGVKAQIARMGYQKAGPLGMGQADWQKTAGRFDMEKFRQSTQRSSMSLEVLGKGCMAIVAAFKGIEVASNLLKGNFKGVADAIESMPIIGRAAKEAREGPGEWIKKNFTDRIAREYFGVDTAAMSGKGRRGREIEQEATEEWVAKQKEGAEVANLAKQIAERDKDLATKRHNLDVGRRATQQFYKQREYEKTGGEEYQKFVSDAAAWKERARMKDERAMALKQELEVNRLVLAGDESGARKLGLKQSYGAAIGEAKRQGRYSEAETLQKILDVLLKIENKPAAERQRVYVGRMLN